MNNLREEDPRRNIARLEAIVREREEELARERAARLEAEEKGRILDALMEHVPEAVIIADAPEVTVRMVSKHTEEMAGRSRETLEGLSIDKDPENWVIYHGDGATQASKDELPVVRATKLGEVVLDEEWILRRPDGERISILVNACPIRDPDGRITGGIAVWRDITARKRAEEALQQSEMLYRSIGESIDFGVWVCAPDGRNIYASESFLKMVGITQEQCSDFGWGDSLHPDDSERTIVEWKECVRTGGKWDIEHRFRGLDGEWHHVLARGVPVRNEQGEITSWAGINLDITARKRTEEKLTSSLAEKDVLMRELAHRTKNNMQLIASLITLQSAALTDRNITDALADTQDRIRAMALVHENIYRSDNLAALGMNQYATDLVASLLAVHRGRAGTVTPVFDVEDIPIPIDAAVPLGLIINELTTNSLKHAYPGGSSGRIFLSLRRNGEGIEMRYRDDGPGLPRELDLARVPSLGLKLVHSIAVRQLRGDMEIRHDPVPEFVFRFSSFAHIERG